MSDEERGFCGYCGASIPHRDGEGRCDKCMHHLPPTESLFAQSLSDSVAPQLMCELARAHGNLFYEDSTCQCYDYQNVFYILEPQEQQMNADQAEYEKTDRGLPTLEDETSFPEEGCAEPCDSLDEMGDAEFISTLFGNAREPNEVRRFQVHDISTERVRVYRYDDGEVRIENPTRLFISESGSHRVQAEDGWVSYILPGWRLLQWLPVDPELPVVL